MILVFQACGIQELQGPRGFQKDFKGRRKDQGTMCGRIGVPEGSARGEAVCMKPKLQWRLQDVGEDMNMEHLPRKVAENE
jgi:hypothetical protein